MKAAEIREKSQQAVDSAVNAPQREQAEFHLKCAKVMLLGEIAAQLSELNERLALQSWEERNGKIPR